jgi:hypothetical protein
MSARVRTELFSILIPLERLKRTVTHCQKMDEWLAVKAGRYPRFFSAAECPRVVGLAKLPLYGDRQPHFGGAVFPLQK